MASTASPPHPPIPWDVSQDALNAIKNAAKRTNDGGLDIGGTEHFFVADGQPSDCGGSAWVIDVRKVSDISGAITLPIADDAMLAFMQAGTFSKPNKWTDGGTTKEAVMASGGVGKLHLDWG